MTSPPLGAITLYGEPSLPYIVFVSVITVTGKVPETLVQDELQRINVYLGQNSRGYEIQEHDADICLTSGESHLAELSHDDGGTNHMASTAWMLVEPFLLFLSSHQCCHGDPSL